ncbi:MAG: tRNA epoxyqueuosine(34) reductase QueG [Terrimicrobiaceae bacterium]|nr:tRNA epoxyqueuosine(34) reductase QueG [Terrimicrobiaceae bacterium]
MTKDRLHELAAAAGFDAVGVAPAVRAPHADSFQAWLGEGMHASMDWLAREPETRCRPDLLLPGARSVVALAMNYFLRDGERPVGRIARYARGRDYHHLIRKRLKRLDTAMMAEGGRQRCFVDSGPLLERDFAVLAGLAWHGKSTLALHPKLGTWFLLAAVITTLEFEPDSKRPDRCGSCTRCMVACPTGAIVAPHKVDARRCLSYWTIEHEGTFPEWVREALGDRIFGCDDCLDACPWNRFAEDAREADFRARPASLLPLRDYLGLDDETFRRLFEGSPIRRTGRQGFLRNVCTALGHVGQTEDLESLHRAAQDADEVVAEHARWALNRLEARA